MKIENILWGILLIILGVIFGLNALEITNIDIFFSGWWTLFIIVPCFIGLFKESDKTGNIIGILLGIVLLLCCQDILSFEIVWKLMIPVILIIIGCSLIFKDIIHRNIKEKIKTLKNTKDSYCATFGSQNVSFDKEEFKGCELNAIFGEMILDLREAEIKNDVVITSSIVFGEVKIYVPSNIKVKVKSTPIFGEVKNKCKNINNEGAFTMYIDATCIFGGAEIK